MSCCPIQGRDTSAPGFSKANKNEHEGAGKMISTLELKAELLVEGIVADKECLESLGKVYKEQNHGLFGWDFEDHQHSLLPDDFLLPDETVVQFRLNTRSPYRVQQCDGTMTLFHNEERLCEVLWLARPQFYRRETSNGNAMVKIGQVGGEDCLFFCYQNYCAHFAKHKECLFCNLVSTSKTYDSVLKRKDIDDIGEVAAAAWQEGMVKHVLLTGGCFNHEKETELVSTIIESIKKHTGLDRIPGTVLPSPAKNDDIQRYFDTGVQAIGFSMEIWDEKLYSAICPGKAESTTHDEFLRSIRKAVDVFGPGNVYGVFVLGLEPRDSFIEGVKVLSEAGANTVPFVWSPNPGSKLAGHRAPGARWYHDVVSEAAEIVLQNRVPPGTENHCYRCDGNSLLHDALLQKGVR